MSKATTMTTMLIGAATVSLGDTRDDKSDLLATRHRCQEEGFLSSPVISETFWPK
jgi:hypothetical protein